MNQRLAEKTSPCNGISRNARRSDFEVSPLNPPSRKETNSLEAISIRDDADVINQLDRWQRRAQTRHMKISSSDLSNAAKLLLAFLFLCGAIWAEDREDPDGTTLIVVADRHISDGLWPFLVDSLRLESAWESRNSPIDGNPTIMLAERTTPGPEFPRRVLIQLLGRCELGPASFGSREGPLGWVLEYQGKIQPDIRVNCARLIQYLRPVIALMPNQKREQAISQALSRIVLHEWIHVATQNTNHDGHGVMQSELSIRDLIAPIPQEPAANAEMAVARRGWGLRNRAKHAAVRSELRRPELAANYAH
jgi:hypothetical protein